MYLYNYSIEKHNLIEREREREIEREKERDREIER